MALCQSPNTTTAFGPEEELEKAAQVSLPIPWRVTPAFWGSAGIQTHFSATTLFQLPSSSRALEPGSWLFCLPVQLGPYSRLGPQIRAAFMSSIPLAACCAFLPWPQPPVYPSSPQPCARRWDRTPVSCRQLALGTGPTEGSTQCHGNCVLTARLGWR